MGEAVIRGCASIDLHKGGVARILEHDRTPDKLPVGGERELYLQRRGHLLERLGLI